MTPDKLQHVWLVVTIAAILVTAIGTYYTYYFGEQIQKEKQAKFNILEKDFNSVEKEFTIEQERLKSILVRLKVTFTGEWKVSPANNKLLNPLGEPIMYLFNANDHSMKLGLYETNNFRFNDLNSQKSEFIVELSPLKQDIIESTKSSLKDFTAIQMVIPFIDYNSFGPIPINVDNIEMKIFINEKLGYELKDNLDYNIVLDNRGSNYAGWAIFSLQFEPNFINQN